MSSYAECIQEVQTQCPNADIANVKEGGSGGCFCQYGNNFEVDSSAEWENCDLSTVGTKYNFTRKFFFIIQQAFVFFENQF